MKKIVALLLTVVTCIGLLAGCGTAGTNNGNTRTMIGREIFSRRIWNGRMAIWTPGGCPEGRS